MEIMAHSDLYLLWIPSRQDTREKETLVIQLGVGGREGVPRATANCTCPRTRRTSDTDMTKFGSTHFPDGDGDDGIIPKCA
jgi:hypothetical protein